MRCECFLEFVTTMYRHHRCISVIGIEYDYVREGKMWEMSMVGWGDVGGGEGGR